MLFGKVPFIYFFGATVLPKFYNFLYKVKYIGTENIPQEGAVIIASNHLNARDPIFLATPLKRQIHYMAKDGLFKNKFIGWVLRKAGAFPVARGTGGADALQEAYDILNDAGLLGVFIEGTRSKDGEPLKPKTGVSLLAYQTKATVVPVAITAKGGTLPLPYRKKPMIVSYGKPIAFEDLGMEDGTSMHYRRCAKLIMAEISKLREQSIAIMEAEN